MKIISIVGARPQFIKLSPLSKVLRKRFKEIVIHTGQHYDYKMSKLFFEELKIPEPQYNLNVGSYPQGTQFSHMIADINEVLEKEKPDLVIVYGDTNTTLSGTLAALKLNIKIIHVEAGLRSFNKTMPEELNRILTDHSSDILFAPTKTAVNNLKKEGLYKRTYLTGDIMVDAILMNMEIAEKKSGILKQLHLLESNYNLLTLHRPYNVDNEIVLSRILNAVAGLNEKIIFPVHPRTSKIIKTLSYKFSDNIKFIEPVGYLDFLVLQKNSKKIYTDSGGIQKEAYILKKPCITLRPETEWIETLRNNWNILIDPSSNSFERELQRDINPCEYDSIFGDNVAEIMVGIIEEYLKG